MNAIDPFTPDENTRGRPPHIPEYGYAWYLVGRADMLFEMHEREIDRENKKQSMASNTGEAKKDI